MASPSTQYEYRDCTCTTIISDDHPCDGGAGDGPPVEPEVRLTGKSRRRRRPPGGTAGRSGAASSSASVGAVSAGGSGAGAGSMAAVSGNARNRKNTRIFNTTALTTQPRAPRRRRMRTRPRAQTRLGCSAAAAARGAPGDKPAARIRGAETSCAPAQTEQQRVRTRRARAPALCA
eukprot:SAG22_NODE_418_length_10750_cov_11.722280_8_plen_176_part_00